MLVAVYFNRFYSCALLLFASYLLHAGAVIGVHCLNNRTIDEIEIKTHCESFWWSLNRGEMCANCKPNVCVYMNRILSNRNECESKIQHTSANIFDINGISVWSSFRKTRPAKNLHCIFVLHGRTSVDHRF